MHADLLRKRKLLVEDMDHYLKGHEILYCGLVTTKLISLPHCNQYKFSLCAGLSGTSLFALSKLMSNVEVADDIIGVIRQVIGQFSMKNLEMESIEVPISVKLWRVPGCHELLASLGKTPVCMPKSSIIMACSVRT
jgi:hypothetical protein